MKDTPSYVVVHNREVDIVDNQYVPTGKTYQTVHQVVYWKTENGQILADNLEDYDYEKITKSKYRRLKKKLRAEREAKCI